MAEIENFSAYTGGGKRRASGVINGTAYNIVFDKPDVTDDAARAALLKQAAEVAAKAAPVADKKA